MRNVLISAVPVKIQAGRSCPFYRIYDHRPVF
jgi:hypothetical protein